MKRKLKTDLHLHTRDDLMDNIEHSAETLIDKAAKQGYEVLSITNHNVITYPPRLVAYARERGILLIPGCEVNIGKKHVLLYNLPVECQSFEQIMEKKDRSTLVMAPHPYYPTKFSLNRSLDRHLDAFDALEYCHYYHKWINFNKKVVDLSRKENLPLLGTSDTHNLLQFGLTYSLIEAEKDMESIFEAIREGKVEIFTRPLSFLQLMSIRFGKQFCRIFRIDPSSLWTGLRLPPPVKLRIVEPQTTRW